MTIHTSPLQLLKKPSEATFAQLQRALVNYLEAPEQKPALEAVANSVGQIHSVFVLLNQDSAAALMQELRALVRKLAAGTINCNEAVQNALSQGVLKAQQYFELLSIKGAKPDLDLSIAVDCLRTLHDSASIHASPQTQESGLDTDHLTELAARLRPKLQRTLLGVLRERSGSVDDLLAIFTQFEQAANNTEHDQRLWWLAKTLAEQLIAGNLPLDQENKLILRDMERQLSDLTQAKNAIAQTLIERLEAQLVKSTDKSIAWRDATADTARPQKPGQTRSDPHGLSNDSVALIDSATLAQITRLLSAEMVLIEDALDRFARASKSRDGLHDAVPRLHDLANILILLNLHIPAKLARRQQQALEQWLQSSDPIRDEQILPVAGALTLVQISLRGLDEFVHNQALSDAVEERLGENEQVDLLLALDNRHARAALCREAGKALNHLHQFITHSGADVAPPDQQQSAMLGQLDLALNELRVSFTLLESAAGATLASRLRKAIAQTDVSILTDQIADIVIALGRALEQLAAGEQIDASALDSAGLRLEELMQAAAAADDTDTDTPASQQSPLAVAADVDTLSDTLSDDSLTIIDADALLDSDCAAVPSDLVDQDIPLDIADAVGLEDCVEIDPEAAQAEVIVDTQSEPVEPALGTMPGADMEAAASSHLEGFMIEPEFVEVFLEEIRGESETIQTQLAARLDNPSDPEPLAVLRRSFHTLKGSGRIVGAHDLGDFAWHFETALNRVIEGQQTGSQALFDTVGDAQKLLDSIVDTNSLVAGSVAFNELGQRIRALTRDEPANPENSQQAIADTDRETTVEITDETVSLPEVVEPEFALAVASAVEDDVSATRAPTTSQIAASSKVLSSDLDEELIQAYITEANDIIDASDFTLQRWSAQPEDQEALNDLRRDMHTLKGSSRMTGVFAIGDLAHAMESVLDAVHKGTVSPSSVTTMALQQALDGLSNMLARVKEGVFPTPADDLINEIESLLEGEPTKALMQPRAVQTPQQGVSSEAKISTPVVSDNIRVSASLLNRLVNETGESSIFSARIGQGIGTLRFGLNELDQTVDRLHSQLRRLDIETEAQILFRREDSYSKQDFDPLELDRFSELQQLSRSLLEIVDDLTNVRNNLEDQAHSIGFLLDQQGKVNKDIQQGLMQTRMVPFSSVLPRLQRVVRQAAGELGKKAELIVQGSEGEVDRTVLDNMVAPLEHMLRNAIAHGVETPDVRRGAGKPEAGTISLALYREGAELVLTLSDDGDGVNFDAIRAKSEAQGLLSPEQSASEQDLLDLLLQPGFSTATEVTKISGRGVGLDVLNDVVRSMRGALQIGSVRGQGTVFTIRLPFSLALTQALLIQAGGDTYAIPLLSLEAVDRLEDKNWRAFVNGQKVMHHYADNDYPLYSLDMIFGAKNSPDSGDNRQSALLFRSAEASAALHVGAVLGSQEIIVKPVSPQLLRVPGVSGATVLSDGRVVIVLELASLVRGLSQTRRTLDVSVLQRDLQDHIAKKPIAMVIDDSITMRKVTARALERHNINPVLAKDGMEAVALLEEQIPNIVILDIEMPRMDGFEVAAHIRNQEHLRDIPILMVTSRGGEKHRQRAAKLGVNGYLVKPYQEEELMRAIHKLMDERVLKLNVS